MSPGREARRLVRQRMFWHRCPHCNLSLEIERRVLAHQVRTERERDERNLAALRDMGWRVHVIWECQLKKKKIDETFAELLPVLAEELGKKLGGACEMRMRHATAAIRRNRMAVRRARVRAKAPMPIAQAAFSRLGAGRGEGFGSSLRLPHTFLHNSGRLPIGATAPCCPSSSTRRAANSDWYHECRVSDQTKFGQTKIFEREERRGCPVPVRMRAIVRLRLIFELRVREILQKERYDERTQIHGRQ